MNTRQSSRNGFGSSSRSARLPFALLCAAVLFAVLAASSQAAAFSEVFCRSGSAAGQCELPKGVALDPSGGPGGSSGSVYLADTNNRRVDVFEATTGKLLMAFGTGVANGANELQTCTLTCGRGRGEGEQPTDVVIDPASHDLYVVEAVSANIRKLAYNPGTEKFELLLSFGAKGSGPGQLDGLMPLAVDAAGHLWVGGVNRLQSFSEAGSFLSEVKLPEPGTVRALVATASGDFYTVTDLTAIQRISPPASGTYTLTVEGHTTAALSAEAGSEATAAEVEAALNAVTALPRFYVTGPQGGPFLAEFRIPGAPLATANAKTTASAGSVTLVQEGGLARQIDKLGPSGEFLEALDQGGHPQALGLDPATGDLYAGDCSRTSGSACESPYTLLRYDSSGAQTEAWGAGEVIGAPSGNALAFDPALQRLFVASSSGEGESAGQIFRLPPPGPLVEAGSTKASAVRKSTATLKANVNPEGVETKFRFQYIPAAEYEAQKSKAEEEGRTPEEVAEAAFGGAEETPLSASLGEDFAFHNATAAVTSLQPATAYRFRVLASNSAGETKGEAASFETLPPAEIDASVADVTASSATLLAQIDPLGDATTYRFEYLTVAKLKENEEAGEPPFTGAAQAPLQPASIGSGEAAVSVSQHLQGLAPRTAYRYRVVVTNAAAPAGFGSLPLTFTTQPPAGTLALPDARQWELVSPPQKHGALLLPVQQQSVIQAAASGEAIAYLATAPTEAEPQGYAEVVQVLSARGPSGWSSRDIVAPHPSATGLPIGAGLEYRAFSSDLSHALLQPLGLFEPSLSAEATEQTPFLRTDFGSEPGSFCTSSCYLPLLTPGNVTSGNPFGRCSGTNVTFCGAVFSGATPDLSHVVLDSGVALTSAPGDKGGLYEWSEGQLQIVSVMPGGAPAEPRLVGPQLGRGSEVARGAVSADGSRVFWSEALGQHHLYLRDLARGETVQLDAVQGGSGSGSPAPRFQLATEDGRRVFFTDSQPLTPDSGAALSSPDLYECRIEEEAGHLRCALSDLTPLAGGESAGVQGLLIGASADGSYLYFAARGVLADNQGPNGERASPGDCTVNFSGEGPGTCNLYLRHEGQTSFIATLADDDQPDWSGFAGGLMQLTARVSPSGRWLAFMSQRPLTGYDNRDAVSGRRDQEVFLYEAEANGGQGTLICASCSPTGARPHGIEYGSGGENMPLAGGSSVWPEHTWIAANIPAWTPYRLSDALYQPRYLSDSGRLFFNSHDALSPQDTNGVVDAYQYEPPQGEGSPPNDSCTESDPTYDPAAQGCVTLLSSGASPEESAFLDASESGSDVFFLTNSRLSPLDTDGARDVYDAHACSAESPCPPPPPPPKPACEGDSCQLPAGPPEDATPGSLTYQGPGNEHPAPPARKPCPKGTRKVKSRGKVICRKPHHRKRSHKRTTTHNRGGHR